MSKISKLPSADDLFGARQKPQVAAPPGESLDPHASTPAHVPAGTPAHQHTSMQPAESSDSGIEKMTFYYHRTTLQQLEATWMKLRQTTGRKITKSAIVEAAVRFAVRDPQAALALIETGHLPAVADPTRTRAAS